LLLGDLTGRPGLLWGTGVGLINAQVWQQRVRRQHNSTHPANTKDEKYKQ
jgi:hypothetical protein